MRNFLPEILALSASSPFVENVNTGLHSARTQIFTRFFPRCGVPDAFASWDEYERFVRFLYETGSITEHTQIWWSVRPHLAFPTIEIRISDGQPELAEAQSLAAFAAALAARVARAVRRGRARRAAAASADRGELLARDPLGALRRADRLRRAARRSRRAQRLEELIEWVLPVAEEIGAAPYLAVPERNAAERQIERLEDGASLEEIYAEQVGGATESDRWLRSDARPPTRSYGRRSTRSASADVLVQALATTASIGFRRVSAEARDLPQVRLAIESIRALEPVLRDGGVEEALVRDLEQARMNLQLAYAAAVAAATAARCAAAASAWRGLALCRADALAMPGVRRDASAVGTAVEPLMPGCPTGSGRRAQRRSPVAARRDRL